jgi:SAM-dependent methyltransferase
MAERTCNVCGGALGEALAAVEDPQTRERFRLLRCGGCGLGHTDPRPDDLAPYYGPAYHGGRHGVTDRICTRRRVRFLASAAGPGAGRRLLDVGCGDGSFLIAARGEGWTVAGVEMNPSLAREAGLDARETIEEAAGLGPFDAVTLWHSLEHLPDPRGAAVRLAGLLAPGGALLVAVPDAGGLQARVFGRRWLHLDVPRHLYHFDAGSLARLLEGAGLRPERWRHQEFEYDLMGLAQSASNAVFPVPNVFLNRLMGRPTGVGPALEAAAVAAGALLTGLLLPAVPLAAAAGRGGTLVVAARKA